MSDANLSRVKRLRKAMSNDPTRFITAYVVTGLLAILIPGCQHAVTMAKYRRSYYYSYIQQQDSGDATDVNNCKWFNPWCSPVWVNANGEYAGQNNEDGNDFYRSVPSWISGWGADTGNSRDDASRASSPGLRFVYAWQTILFLGLLGYGSMIIFKYRGNFAESRVALHSLLLLIFAFGNFSFLSMWMIANGSILTAGVELEDIGGFYHQFSVMMFLTDFWYLIWCFLFGFAVARRYRQACKEAFIQKETGTDYAAHDGDLEEKLTPAVY